MFIKGFQKVAVAPTVNLTPEDYFAAIGEKDPYVGAVLGAAAGTAAGAIKGKHNRSKAALLGNLAGGATGGAAGYLGGKAVRSYQARKVRRLTGELNLRATPSRGHHGENQ